MHNTLLCGSNYHGIEEEEDQEVIDIKRDWSRYEEYKSLTTEGTIMINLGNYENVKEVKIRKKLSSSETSRLVELLKEYQDVFAWSYVDMPGLDPSIMEHSLPIDLSIPLKKQKLQRTKLELSKKIEEEVTKLLKVGFIEVITYPNWVANIILVIKKVG